MNKKELIEVCLQVINTRLTQIQKGIDDYKVDLLSETKSSAGDKHETGRAMMQLEMEKLGQQYQTVLMQKQILLKIDNLPTTTIKVGSLVLLSGTYYFLASSLGVVQCKNQSVMVVSINSPIGKLLLGKQEHDEFTFNGKKLSVDKVL